MMVSVVTVYVNQMLFKEVARLEKNRGSGRPSSLGARGQGMYKSCSNVRFAPAANKLWVSPECKLRNCIHEWLSA